MSLKVWLINLALIIVSTFLVLEAREMWTMRRQPDHDPPVGDVSIQGEAKPLRRNDPAESRFNVAVDGNLFSPERKEYVPPVEETEPAEPEVKSLLVKGKKIVLHGVILMDGYRKALISNPDRKSDERKDLWVTEGGDIGGLKVEAIRNESILLSEKGDRYEIRLYEKDKPRASGFASRGTSERGTSEGEGTGEPMVIETGEAKPKPEKKEAPGSSEVEADGEYEIIQTPFGEIKRKKRS